MSDPELRAEVNALRAEVERLARRRTRGLLVSLALLAVGGIAFAQPTIRPFVADQPALASDVNDNFSSLAQFVVPPGGIVFFEAAACPMGWSPIAAAHQGRAIVARPSGGTPAQTFGAAITGNAEPSHAHSTSSAGSHAHSGATSGWIAWINGVVNYNVTTGFNSPWQIQQGLSINAAGDHAHNVTTTGAGSVLPYVYLTACRKNP